jgi:TolB-like protein
MPGLFEELKRRNVFRVGLTYLVGSWLLLQIIDVIGPILHFSDELARYILFLLAVGFIPVLVLAWAFELTPEGVKFESEVDRSRSMTHRTGRRLDRIIMVILALAVGFLLFDKLALSPDHSEPAPGREVAAGAVSIDRQVAAPSREAGASALKSVAVLPFVAMSNGPDDDYFSDGLTEEIINALAQLPELLVTARTSAFHFKGRNVPITEVAAQLGVDHIVEGSVRRAGEQLRIAAQLIRAGDGFHLWSETYDRRTEDTFAVQSDIAEKVAMALNVILDDDQRARMSRVGVRNVEAYTAYQKGLEAHGKAHVGGIQFPYLREGNRHFEEATALAPELSDAYLNHADLFVHMLLTRAAGRLDGNISEDDLENAPAAMRHDLDQAVRNARNPEQRLMAHFDRALLLGEWRGLGSLSELVLSTPGCELALWSYLTGSAFGQAELLSDAYARKTACDPLLPKAWRHYFHANLWLGQPERSVQIVGDLSSYIRQATLDVLYVKSLWLSGEWELARQTANSRLNSEQDRLRAQIFLTLIQGDLESAARLQENYFQSIGPDDLLSVVAAAQGGMRNEANRLAGLVDRRPFGYITLMQAVYNCTCGAPFDLEAAPVFARMIAESGLPWPPVKPIDFPLKDW